MTGILVVVAGPSGVGKGTVIGRVLDRVDDAEVSVSATTRGPRPGEVDGQHYHFLTREDFERLVDEDGFLEWAEYAGNLYGTPARTIRQRLDEGRVVFLDIEAQGAAQVRRLDPDALLVFLVPPSREELERRLRARGTESDEVVAERLRVAEWELEQADQFDVVVVNDDVSRAAREVIAAIEQRRGA